MTAHTEAFELRHLGLLHNIVQSVATTPNPADPLLLSPSQEPCLYNAKPHQNTKLTTFP